MIPNLQPNTTYAVHLRAASTSGGKDWVGSVTTNGEMHTFWGRTNQINQHAAKPGDMNVLLRLINQKQGGKDKYTMVDEYTQQDGWKSQKGQTTAQSPPKQTTPPVVNWVDAPTTAIEWDF